MKEVWKAHPPAVLNRVWLSPQTCLQDIMLAGRDNEYKLPHIGKGKHERAGTLPWQLECSEATWAKGEQALAQLEARAAGGRSGADIFV